jgi:hypothetical protein
VEANQEKTNKCPHHDRDARPTEVEAHEHDRAAEHDGEDVRAHAKPQRELVTDPAMALAGGDLVDRADLDPGESVRVLLPLP